MFYPKSVAVIGASDKVGKVGHTIFKNLLDNFRGKVFAINPKHEQVLGQRCYKSVKDVKEHVDMAVVVVPARVVPQVLKELGEKGVRDVIVVSSGFGEVGNTQLEQEMKEVAQHYNMRVIGPNCLGVYVPDVGLDTLFMPFYKSSRPKPGNVAFISQSGAVGTAILDWADELGIGISKFISYGNATVMDESDLLLLLTNDPKTDVIVLYVEGVKDGRKFFEALRTASKRKVVVVLKAGKSEEGNKAAKSHTGNLAGNYLIYKAAFRQSGVIEVKNLSEAFGVLELMKQPLPKGNRVAVITNGGGFGVLTADAIANTSLTLAPLSKQTRAKLRAVLPPYLNVNNPIDVGGDADAQRYKDVLDVVYQDENVDVVIVDLLFQTSALNESVIDVIKSYADTRTKTTLAVSVGGRYSKEKRRIMSLAGIPSFPTPEHAVKSVERLVKWNGYLKTTV